MPPSGIFPHIPTHLTTSGARLAAELRLTCLSVRCLSSCLFSASSKCTSAAGGFAGAGQSTDSRPVYSLLLSTTWLNRRKSVMGNGRWLGRSSGKSIGNSLVWPRAVGSMLALLLAGFVLLGSGSRHLAQQAPGELPRLPIPTSSRSSRHSTPDARAILGQLPLIFEPNQGQADPKVKFLARGAGYSLFLDPTGAVLALQTAPKPQSHSEQFVCMKLVGANPAAATSGIRLRCPAKATTSSATTRNSGTTAFRSLPEFY